MSIFLFQVSYLYDQFALTLASNGNIIHSHSQYNSSHCWSIFSDNRLPYSDPHMQKMGNCLKEAKLH